MRAAAAALVVAAIVAAGCGGGQRAQPAGSLSEWNEVARIEVAEPVGLAVEGADLLIGERLTGRVMRVPIDDPVAVSTVATLDVSTSGQRGLLGLAVTETGTVVASWTRPDEALVVGDVSEPASPIWVGPASTAQATGGRISIIDGAILIGMGDLLDPSAVADPDTPNGKLLTLDPASGETAVFSGGWNNPFAFAATSSGEVVVYDNAPGNSAERLAVVAADGTAEIMARGEAQTAPSGLALIDDTTVMLCRWLPRTLSVIDLEEPDVETVVADDCAYSVIALPDGGLAYGAEDAVVILRR